MQSRKHGGGWLALCGLIAAVVVLAANWNGDVPQEVDRTLIIRADSYNACFTQVTIGGHAFRVLLDSGAACSETQPARRHSVRVNHGPSDHNEG